MSLTITVYRRSSMPPLNLTTTDDHDLSNWMHYTYQRGWAECQMTTGDPCVLSFFDISYVTLKK